MKRRKLIGASGIILATFLLKQNLVAIKLLTLAKFYFKDDGIIPNCKYPLLIYNNAFILRSVEDGGWL